MELEGGARSGWGRLGLAGVGRAGRQWGAEIDWELGRRGKISWPAVAAGWGCVRLIFVHTRAPRLVSPRWPPPGRPRAAGRAPHSLTVFVSSLPPLLPPPAAVSGRHDATAPCCRRRQLAPPAAHCSLRRWRRPVLDAGLKEEEEEARRVLRPMPQPRPGTRHGARAAALAGAHETCMDGHGLESSIFLRRRRRPRRCRRGWAVPPPPALPAAPGVAASVAAQPRAASRRYEARARGEPALGPSALFPDTPGPVGACRGGRRRGATGKASLAPAMHLSWARGAAAGTHPLTERSARGAEERPLPLPPAFPAFCSDRW